MNQNVPDCRVVQKPLRKVYGLHKALLFFPIALAAVQMAMGAANYYVDTAAQFNAKTDKFSKSFSTLRAGDRVYLKGGNWDGLIATMTGSMTDADAQTNPAIIYGCDTNYTPTVGGVTVTNLSSIVLAGQGVALAGLSFTPTSGIYAASTNNDYNGTGGSIISATTGSRYMTISHIKFDYCGRDNTNAYNQHYGPWVYLYGYHHALQYCEMTGRDFNTNDISQTNPNLRTSIRDATVVIYKGSSDTVDFGHHDVRYNYFGQRLVPTSSDSNLYIPSDGSSQSLMGNGWETIRLGVSSTCNSNFATTIEFNSFYRSIYSAYGGANDNNGEPEMLSIKSRGNTIRHNTFLNSYGQLCFREADYGVAEGNFFLGGGAYDGSGNIVFTDPLNYQMSGIRVIGFGHIVTGNYFYRLWGTGGQAALSICEGTNNPGTLTNLSIFSGTVEYKTAVYSQIIGNSFIDCFSINLDCNLSSTQTNRPFATQFQNNLIYYGTNVSGALGVNRDNSSYTLAGYSGKALGNYVYTPAAYPSQLGSAVSILGTNGNTITTNASANPLITALFDVIKVPAANSPLIGGGGALPAINDTSTEATNYRLATNVAVYASIDNRGLPRPTSGQEIGNYEGTSYGTGTRPLRKYEVGVVSSTYFPLLLPSTNATLSVSNLSQTYSGNTITPATSTTVPFNLPVTYSYNGSSNPPVNAGTYTVAAAIYDPIYGGSTTTTLTVTQAISSMLISGTNQAYITNTPRAVTVTTIPTNLPVIVTYSATNYPETTNPPTNAGTYSVLAAISGTANYSSLTTNAILTITAVPAIVSNTNPIALQGQNFIYQIQALNGPTGFSSSNLPAGLSLNTNTGIITGTNATSGTNAFSITISNAQGSSTVTIQLVTTNIANTYTSAGSYTWSCPSNVTAIQIECWGGGGAGGSAYRNPNSSSIQYGGGGAGGAYARKNSYSVIPGKTYYVTVGGGGTAATGTLTNRVAVPGNDSWFSDSNSVSGIILAKGGAGGACAVGNSTLTAFGPGGTGTNLGSIGDVVFAGGSGATPPSSGATYGGAGGGSGGTSSAGNSAVANSGTGASAVAGGGGGGNPNATSGSSSTGQAPTTAPGGGGGGARASSQQSGGNGANGQLIITVTGLSATVTPGNLVQTYDGTPRPVSAITYPSNLPVSISYSNAVYSASGNPPTNVGTYAVMTMITNSSYTGSSNGTLTITPATPLIAISGTTNVPYNGTARSVSASIAPVFIPVSVTYNGSTTPPSAVGIYTVLASNAADALGSNWVASSVTSMLSIYDPVAAWRSSHFGTTSNVGLSSDNATNGNGLNNLQSYTFGVDPSQPTTNTLLMISNTAANAITLSFVARSSGSGPGYNGLNRYYNLEATTNATNGSWNPLPGYSNIQGADQTITLSTNTSVGPRWFYRLKAWLQ